ncbi:hypothetical protein [Variovorax sp.]|nr:hypothetical protein [Variovorax sp.]
MKIRKKVVPFLLRRFVFGKRGAPCLAPARSNSATRHFSMIHGR